MNDRHRLRDRRGISSKRRWHHLHRCSCATGREMKFMSVPTEKVAGTPIRATFLIRSDWANRAAVYPLLVAATESHMLQDVLIVPVTDFDLSDGVFVTITFYPSVLEGRSVKLFIPKTEVLSIMILENYQDRAVLGFHPPEQRT